MSATHAVQVRVSGRVQGVFFRARCAEEANRLGVTGWVANDPDGSVTGHFEGSPDAVDSLVEWCRSGPSRARVEHVTVSTVDFQGTSGFTTH